MNDVINSELGKKSAYQNRYNPDILFAISRQIKRSEIGIDSNNLSFYGWDLWNHYEVSWLNNKGKPQVACARIIYSANTPNIIESKSMKLYFNSFNNTKFNTIKDLEEIIALDLSKAVLGVVDVKLMPLMHADSLFVEPLHGECLDDLDVECVKYLPDPSFLVTHDIDVHEKLHSDLLKSNCLVTNQPDWGSLYIEYVGRQIDHVGLLKYIVSFRDHNEFHEQCVERIFTDIFNHCKPKKLLVYARYTRRGGLDINPCRATSPDFFDTVRNGRTVRQ